MDLKRIVSEVINWRHHDEDRVRWRSLFVNEIRKLRVLWKENISWSA